MNQATQAPPKIRPSKNARKRAAVLILVHVLVAVHVAHWLSGGKTLSPLEPSEAMEFSKHGVVNAGLVFFGLTILSTLVLGRWFCGWACHLVALQDLCLWLLKKVGIRPRPLRSRLLGLVPIVAAVYMFLYPLGYRIWRGADLSAHQVILTRENFWATFPPWPVALVTFAVCGFATVYFLGAKGFCTYACPYGAFFGLADKLAIGRIRVTDACAGCAHCTATCTSNVVVHEEVRRYGMVVDPGCMKCLDCVSVCPMNALYYGFGRPSLLARARAAWRSRPAPGPGEELLLGLGFAAAFLVYRGLYGVVPFLLALGIAGILAYLLLVSVRLARRPALSLGPVVLRAGGRLSSGGRWFVAAGLALLGLTVHSALVQYHARMSTLAYERASADAAVRAEVATRGLRHASFVERFGLLQAPQNELERAWFQASLGLGEEAVRTYDAVLASRPTATAFDRLAQLHWRAGRPAAALEVYRRAVAWDPDDPDLAFNLGVAAGGLGLLDEAIDAFRRVLVLQPDRIAAMENLTGLLAGAGRFREVIENADRLLALRPGDEEALRVMTTAYVALGDLAGGRARLDAGERSGTVDVEVLRRLRSLVDEAERRSTAPESGPDRDS